MASERQIEANKLNAQRSTGPRTWEGKARVASNALKHGLTGKRIVLPNEDPEEFEALRIPILEAAVHARGQQELIVKGTTAQIAGINAAAERNIAIEMLLRSEKREFTPEEHKALDAAETKLKEARTRLDEPTIRVTQVFERHADELEHLWQ